MGANEEMKYVIPEGALASPCRGCGKLIYWITTDRGQHMPLDLDGEPHWGTCPKADEFRQEEDPRQQQFDFEEVPF